MIIMVFTLPTKALIKFVVCLYFAKMLCKKLYQVSPKISQIYQNYICIYYLFCDGIPFFTPHCFTQKPNKSFVTIVFSQVVTVLN